MYKKGGIISSITMFIIIIMLIAGIFLYLDAKQIQQQFPVSPKIIIYKDEKSITAGINGVFNQSEPDYLGAEEIEKIDGLYKENQLDKILGDNYRLIIVREDAFDELSGSINFLNKDMNIEFMKKILGSRDPFLDIAKEYDITYDEKAIQAAQVSLKEKFIDEATLKSAIFSLLFEEAIEQKGPSILLLEHKKNNMMIYPESILIRAVKVLPDSIIIMIGG